MKKDIKIKDFINFCTWLKGKTCKKCLIYMECPGPGLIIVLKNNLEKIEEAMRVE